MSNVIFGYQIIRDEEETESLIIDSNARADEAVRLREQEMLRAKRLQAMREAGDEVPEGVEPNEFLDLADSIMQEEAPELMGGVMGAPVVDTKEAEAILEQARAEAMEIIEDARRQSDEMLSQAQLDGDAIRTLAKQDGRSEGYNEGTQKAALELASMQEKMQAELDAMNEEMQRERLSMERNIVNLCMDTFEKVFGATLTCEPEILYHLLDNCLMNIEPTHQMQIKVCESDAEYIRTKKDEIIGRFGSSIVVDIIVDPLMSQGSCIIETDGGLFDCSVDTELKELSKRIRALA